jgi:hypothetical protein
MNGIGDSEPGQQSSMVWRSVSATQEKDVAAPFGME